MPGSSNRRPRGRIACRLRRAVCGRVYGPRGRRARRSGHDDPGVYGGVSGGERRQLGCSWLVGAGRHACGPAAASALSPAGSQPNGCPPSALARRPAAATCSRRSSGGTRRARACTAGTGAGAGRRPTSRVACTTWWVDQWQEHAVTGVQRPSLCSQSVHSNQQGRAVPGHAVSWAARGGACRACRRLTGGACLLAPPPCRPQHTHKIVHLDIK